jgi:hypothetical protein
MGRKPALGIEAEDRELGGAPGCGVQLVARLYVVDIVDPLSYLARRQQLPIVSCVECDHPVGARNEKEVEAVIECQSFGSILTAGGQPCFRDSPSLDVDRQRAVLVLEVGVEDAPRVVDGVPFGLPLQASLLALDPAAVSSPSHRLGCPGSDQIGGVLVRQTVSPLGETLICHIQTLRVMLSKRLLELLPATAKQFPPDRIEDKAAAIALFSIDLPDHFWRKGYRDPCVRHRLSVQYDRSYSARRPRLDPASELELRGLSNGYWLRAQAAYDTEVAEEALARSLEKIKPWEGLRPHAGHRAR